MSGKHIELFLVDGKPGGLTTAEIMNWTGRVLSARRSGMSALIRRKELTGTCVYLLLGEDAEGSVRCYVGETDDFAAVTSELLLLLERCHVPEANGLIGAAGSEQLAVA